MASFVTESSTATNDRQLHAEPRADRNFRDKFHVERAVDRHRCADAIEREHVQDDAVRFNCAIEVADIGVD